MRHDMTKWEPVSDIVSLQDEMNRLFLDFFGRSPGRRLAGDNLWAPVMDIEETKDDIIVKAEIPGMTKEDVKIQITGDILTISGERKRGGGNQGQDLPPDRAQLRTVPADDHPAQRGPVGQGQGLL